jgi:hypothetical protein
MDDLPAGSERASGVRKMPFQTHTRPRIRPLLALRAVLLAVALALTIASVSALRKKRDFELWQDQGAPAAAGNKKGSPVWIDVSPPRAPSAPAGPGSAAPTPSPTRGP